MIIIFYNMVIFQVKKIMKYLEKLEGCLCLASSFLYNATGKEVESVMGYCTAVVLHKFYCTDFIGLSKNVNAGQNKAEINEVEVKGKKIHKDTEILHIKILNNNILTCNISRIFLVICLPLKYASL